MTIERARARIVSKPWGVTDVRPWSTQIADGRSGTRVGEIWYERPGQPVLEPALLLKLLFTDQPLSIQVHPDDTYAHAMGQGNGKTEAWYVLQAAAGAVVALGLKRRCTPQQLRAAIGDGSIAELVAWGVVSAGAMISVPAGTIHAIGAGLIIAEIQQRSDTTFRLFDYGRQRELHMDRAVAVANAGPPDPQIPPHRISDERQLLIANAHFVFERIELAAHATCRLDATRETWLLVLGGTALAGSFDVATGDALFAQSDGIKISVGEAGILALVAYAGNGGLVPELLHAV